MCVNFNLLILHIPLLNNKIKIRVCLKQCYNYSNCTYMIQSGSKCIIEYSYIAGVEERKEKAKSTPLLSSHEDLAKGNKLTNSGQILNYPILL